MQKKHSGRTGLTILEAQIAGPRGFVPGPDHRSKRYHLLTEEMSKLEILSKSGKFRMIIHNGDWKNGQTC